MNDIYLRIKKIRKEHSLNQTEFSEKIAISRDVLAKMETRKSFPTIETLYNIVNVYHIDANWLLTGQGEMLKTTAPTLSTNYELVDYLKNEIKELKEENKRLLKENWELKGKVEYPPALSFK